ncbi:MAG: type II toxin-antitoxin system death-on-curing family toxin [Herpetosiphonaceae bacterium]|nr:type II toxin-antitoxin system death-on-curing family toxin [Herpetosiphonaceae bacterium]
MIDIPNLAEILVMHELLLETFGGMRGITEQGFGKIEAAIAAPHQSIFGEDLYPDLPAKATALFFGLARAHGFSDGNKRVALVALIDMLSRNGYQLACDDDTLYQGVMNSADSGTRATAEEWIRSYLVKAA